MQLPNTVTLLDRLGLLEEGTQGLGIPLPSKDSCFKAFGPKDPIIQGIIQGLWAVLSLRVRILNPKP